MKKQVITIKTVDLNKVSVRAFSRSAWEANKIGILKEQVHLDKKRKEPKYKNRFRDLE